MKDPNLEWLLCQMPALMGEASTHQAIVAALEGAGGGGAASSAGAEAVCERARPHVARARRLMAVWNSLELEHRQTLRAHYTAPACRVPGVAVHLGELAGVCLLKAANRRTLEAACSNPYELRNARRIAEGRQAAQWALNAAHRAWQGAMGKVMLSWLRA